MRKGKNNRKVPGKVASEALLTILMERQGPWKITNLMLQLRDLGYLDESLYVGMSPDKAAFRKTFWLNHQLYRLDQDLQQSGEGRILRDSLWIRYEKGFISEGLIPGDDPALAAYYLNPEHYWGTEDEEIEALLQGFWQEYSRWFDRTQILEALGLPEQTGERELKKALKLRVKESHPDQGGDREEFQKVWAAWEKYRQAKNRP